MNHSIQPINHYLLVEKPKEEKRDSLVALPDDYVKKTSPFIVVKFKGAAKDCEFDYSTAENLIVDASMVEEITFEGFEFQMVKENYVKGILRTS